MSCCIDARLLSCSCLTLYTCMRSASALSRTRVVGADKMTMMSNQLNHDILEAGAVRDEIVPAAGSEIWERQP